jgi:hypothetical protein
VLYLRLWLYWRLVAWPLEVRIMDSWPGSLKYGSHTKIMDWMLMSTCRGGGVAGVCAGW